MKRSLVAALVILVGGVWARGTCGQESPTAPPPATGTRVALIDIGQVFKNHVRFKEQLDALKQDVVAHEEDVRQERQAVAKKREILVGLKSGSPEYKQLEQEIAQRISQLQVRDQLKKKDIVEREAKVYYETYQLVVAEVGKVATQYGVSLVLRFDSEKIDPNDRGAVLAGVNRAVVFQSQLDLTPHVLAALNAHAPVTASSPGAVRGAVRPTAGEVSPDTRAPAGARQATRPLPASSPSSSGTRLR